MEDGTKKRVPVSLGEGVPGVSVATDADREDYGSAAGLVERVRRAVHDPERLRVLRQFGLLEIPPGERFDRLTEFASEHLRAPVAMITLIGEERQRRISAVTPLDWQERRWDPVEDALDVVPLALREAVVVEDAGSHPLLRHSSLVRTSGVVAYAAVPLRLEPGLTVGAMSVADLEPRTWGHREIELLRLLARAATLELERLITSSREAAAMRDLEEAPAETESIRRASGDFLSVMTHELRTPLNSIIGYAEMLERTRDGSMTERQRELIGRIGSQSRGLLGLVNDVFRMSRIESGLVTTSETDVDVGAVIQSVAKKLKGRRGDRGVVLRLDLPEHANPLRTDREQLFQILAALVGRALKSTEKGQVVVRLVTDPDTADPREVRVIDTSPGIPADRIPLLFRPFEPAIGPGGAPNSASGLGLPLAQALAGLLGLQIRATSQIGVGTTFILQLGRAD